MFAHVYDIICCLQVMATHPYVGEDTDELTFETGDIVAVIPFEDPEDQVNKHIVRDTSRFSVPLI